jgi:hypothetical protein
MREDIEDLREHAQRCRRLARAVDHPETRAKLKRMAVEFDASAARLEAQLESDTPTENARPATQE